MAPEEPRPATQVPEPEPPSPIPHIRQPQPPAPAASPEPRHHQAAGRKPETRDRDPNRSPPAHPTPTAKGRVVSLVHANDSPICTCAMHMDVHVTKRTNVAYVARVPARRWRRRFYFALVIPCFISGLFPNPRESSPGAGAKYKNSAMKMKGRRE